MNFTILTWLALMSTAPASEPAVVHGRQIDIIRLFESVNVFVDTSGSACPRHFRQTVDDVGWSLPNLTCSLGVSRVSLLFFAAGIDLWSSPVVSTGLPEPPSVQKQEPDLGEAQRIFKKLRQKKEREAQERFAKQWERQHEIYPRAVRDSLAPVLERLDGLHQSESDCTSVNDFALRCASGKGRTLNIGITDGVQDCGHLSSVSVEKGEDIPLTVVFLVPTNGDCQAPGGYGEKFQARAEALRRLLPSAIILPGYASASFETLLQLIMQKKNQVSGASDGGGHE
jgi:hypothetical protein